MIPESDAAMAMLSARPHRFDFWRHAVETGAIFDWGGRFTNVSAFVRVIRRRDRPITSFGL
jgi:hypothetical protein